MEFAIIAPVFMMLLMGLFDIGQTIYARSVLEGAVNEAARLSALETGDTDDADAYISQQVKKITPNATVTASRLSYVDFADLERPEKWNDADDSGDCNDGEEYTDENGNEQWDSDIGQSGNGGANDVVMYTVSVVYEPPFAMPLLPYIGDTRTLEASAITKNQPFANQQGYQAEQGTCD